MHVKTRNASEWQEVGKLQPPAEWKLVTKRAAFVFTLWHFEIYWLCTILTWELFSFWWPCINHTTRAPLCPAWSRLLCFLTELKGTALMINVICQCLEAAVGSHGGEKEFGEDTAPSLLSQEQRWHQFEKQRLVSNIPFRHVDSRRSHKVTARGIWRHFLQLLCPSEEPSIRRSLDLAEEMVRTIFWGSRWILGSNRTFKDRPFHQVWYWRPGIN